MDNITDLARWIYFTNQFLIYFEKCKENSPEHQNIQKQFIENSRVSETFPLWNQGTMLTALYGLLVVPSEFWSRHLSDDSDNKDHKKDAYEITIDDFTFKTRPYFLDADEHESSYLSNAKFLSRLRNSVAHNRVEIVKGEEGIFKFNDRPPGGEINFSVLISPSRLTDFLNEIGEYFIMNTSG